VVAGKKMLLDWLDAREATELGRSLADHLAPRVGEESATRGRKALLSDQKAIQTFLGRVDREARPLKLNLFKRAKLANSFKWRLLESGLEEGRVDELTQMLLMRLTQTGAKSAQAAVIPSAPPAKRVQSGRVDGLLSEGLRLDANGSHTEAIRCYQELLELDPRNATAHNNLGASLLKLGRYPEAEEEFRRAIDLKHKFPEALCNLATVLRWRGRIAESETALRRAVKLSPQNVQAQVSLGLTLTLAGRSGDAKSCFEKALRMAPRHVDALIGGAELAVGEGRFAEAETLIKRALEADPEAPDAWAIQARFRKMTRSNATWVEGAERIAAGGIAAMHEATLRFAIGKYYDDVQDFARAFRSYERANELQKAAANPYDRQARTRLVDDLVRLYTREALSRVGGGASDSERPVLVVGMMRSGTSLVEQIISSHPGAKGAGELNFWMVAARKHETTLRHELPGESLRNQWAEAYLQRLRRYSPDALRVVDKSNFNSDFLGIIHTVFPRARFIHVERDPIDTCLSCYFQQFGAFLNFTMDLSDLAHYYREHRRLVDHWRAVLPPERFLDVPYAGLVADQERWTRKILDFVGLPWDARCLNFQETQRSVLTASAWQVRQKMYQSSVGRWRNYQKFIGPLLELADAEGSRSAG
jgi:tetratricopeptide (TPR) repeat protein